MQAVSYVIQCKRGDRFPLYFIGDIHKGISHCAIDELKAAIALVKKDKNARWVGMGDYIDAVIYTDAKRFDPRTIEGDISHLSNTVKNQCDSFLEDVKCIKDQCLGLIEGNHEATIAKRSGVLDPTYYMAKELGVKYLGYNAIILLTFRRGRVGMDFTIYVHHGYGGGRKMGSNMNKLLDLAGGIDADLYVMGHVHDKVITEAERWYITRKKGHIEPRIKRIHFMLTGSFLKTYKIGPDSYAEKSAFPPTATGVPCLEIFVENNQLLDHLGVLKVKKWM